MTYPIQGYPQVSGQNAPSSCDVKRLHLASYRAEVQHTLNPISCAVVLQMTSKAGHILDWRHEERASNQTVLLTYG